MKQSIKALKNIVKILIATVLLSICVTACETIGGRSKKDIPMETSDREIIQLAQNAYNNNNYRLSSYYYNMLLQRYGNNTKDYIIGNYELAHIAMRKKDYNTAVPLLNEILSIYDDTPAGYLPPSYKILAQNELKKVPEQERSYITSLNKNNDYYENGDYGDSDFFGSPNFDSDDDYNYTGDYSDDNSYWY